MQNDHYEMAKNRLRYCLEHENDIEEHFVPGFHSAARALQHAIILVAVHIPKDNRRKLLQGLIRSICSRWDARDAKRLQPTLTERQKVRLGLLDASQLDRRARNQEYRRNRALEQRAKDAADSM